MVDAPMDESHKAVRAMFQRAHRLGLDAHLLFILAKKDGNWRIAFGRIDLARDDVPSPPTQLLDGKVWVLHERVKASVCLRRIGQALARKPFRCGKLGIDAHGMAATWTFDSRDRNRREFCAAWPFDLAWVQVSERPNAVHENLRSQDGTHGYSGLEGVLAEYAGLTPFYGYRDARIGQVHVLLWDYRGRIDHASCANGSLRYAVTIDDD